jgi:hypothetical protein
MKTTARWQTRFILAYCWNMCCATLAQTDFVGYLEEEEEICGQEKSP